jgi:hypothetical protein
MKLNFDDQGNCAVALNSPFDIPFFYDAPEGYNSELGAYRLNEVISNYTPEQAEQRKRTDLPNWYVWSNITMSWQDTRTTEEIKSQQWAQIKIERDQLLAASDWRVIKAVDTGVPLSEAWRVYRQALRDITTQSDPSNIIWPQAPSA